MFVASFSAVNIIADEVSAEKYPVCVSPILTSLLEES